VRPKFSQDAQLAKSSHVRPNSMKASERQTAEGAAGQRNGKCVKMVNYLI